MKYPTLSVALTCITLTFASVASAQLEHADHPVDPARPVLLAVTGLTVRLPAGGTWRAGSERFDSGARSDTLHYRDRTGDFSAVVRLASFNETRCEAYMNAVSSTDLISVRFAAWSTLYPVMVHSIARGGDVFCVDRPGGAAVVVALRFVGVDSTRLPDEARVSFETRVVEAAVSAHDGVHRGPGIARRFHAVGGA